MEVCGATLLNCHLSFGWSQRQQVLKLLGDPKTASTECSLRCETTLVTIYLMAAVLIRIKLLWLRRLLLIYGLWRRLFLDYVVHRSRRCRRSRIDLAQLRCIHHLLLILLMWAALLVSGTCIVEVVPRSVHIHQMSLAGISGSIGIAYHTCSCLLASWFILMDRWVLLLRLW